jgi:hypothetical protein
VTPARTATDWITLAHNSCRDPLARSISGDRRQQPTAPGRITHRDHRPRKPRALQRRVELVKHLVKQRLASELVILGDRLTQLPHAGESNFGSSTCNDRSRHGRSTSSASNIANSRSLNAPTGPATSRAALRKNPSAKLSSDGPHAPL